MSASADVAGAAGAPAGTVPEASTGNGSAIDAPLSKAEHYIPFVVLGTLLLFVIASCASYYLGKLNTERSPAWFDEVMLAPSLLLILLTASFAVWFILTFTGSPRSKSKREQCFGFAYSFTITSFVVLSFPYLEVWKPDIAGPIGLVRGCIAAPGSNDSSRDPLPPSSVLCRPDDAKTGVTMSYPWVLTIGGFVGTTQCTGGVDCDKGNLTDPHRYNVISGGLAVPFYVVFLAFVGGAVSLSRRIPEYQKRSEYGYKPSSELATLAPLQPYEVRESVVFQIMQLVSAPFIGITAYWAIAPSTVPASIALAFVSGFASETILLLIRGVVDGIRPQTSLFVGAKPATDEHQPDTVDTADTASKIKVRLAVSAEPGVTMDAGSLQMSVDATRIDVTPEGFAEPAIEVGRTYTVVATAKSAGEALKGELLLTATLEDDGKPYEIRLAKAA